MQSCRARKTRLRKGSCIAVVHAESCLRESKLQGRRACRVVLREDKWQCCRHTHIKAQLHTRCIGEKFEMLIGSAEKLVSMCREGKSGISANVDWVCPAKRKCVGLFVVEIEIVR